MSTTTRGKGKGTEQFERTTFNSTDRKNNREINRLRNQLQVRLENCFSLISTMTVKGNYLKEKI